MYNDQTYFEKSPNILCSHRKSFKVCLAISAQKVKFSIKGLFSKCDQIGSFLRTWSHLLKKSLMKNFIFCAVHFSTLCMKWFYNLRVEWVAILRYKFLRCEFLFKNCKVILGVANLFREMKIKLVDNELQVAFYGNKFTSCKFCFTEWKF